MFFSVLRSRNYLFSALTLAPAPPLSIISAPASAPAPAPGIVCHLKLYYNRSRYHKKYVAMEVFLHPGILKTDCSKFVLKIKFWHNFGSTGSDSGSATLGFRHLLDYFSFSSLSSSPNCLITSEHSFIRIFFLRFKICTRCASSSTFI